jgi:hypothetical protein
VVLPWQDLSENLSSLEFSLFLLLPLIVKGEEEEEEETRSAKQRK